MGRRLFFISTSDKNLGGQTPVAFLLITLWEHAYFPCSLWITRLSMVKLLLGFEPDKIQTTYRLSSDSFCFSPSVQNRGTCPLLHWGTFLSVHSSHTCTSIWLGFRKNAWWRMHTQECLLYSSMIIILLIPLKSTHYLGIQILLNRIRGTML
jgi:hypothetical protein